jgi:hypothetical protein
MATINLSAPTLKELCVQHLLARDENIILTQTKEIRQSLDLELQRVEKKKMMINMIFCCLRDTGAYVYGGFLRDLLAAKPFRDIDIHFPNETSVQEYISELSRVVTITTVSDKGGESKYDESFSTKTIIVQKPQFSLHGENCGHHPQQDDGHSFLCGHHPQPDDELYIFIDLVWPNGVNIDGTTSQCYDFDVNMLRCDEPWTGSLYDNFTSLTVRNPNCKLTSVVDNIHNRQFVVLSRGRLLYDHDNIDSCIHRYSRQGKKLLLRMAKMKKRGWTCLNDNICSNPMCILAPGELYYDYLSDKHDKIKEEKQRDKLEEGQWKIGEQWIIEEQWLCEKQVTKRNQRKKIEKDQKQLAKLNQRKKIEKDQKQLAKQKSKVR